MCLSRDHLPLIVAGLLLWATSATATAQLSWPADWQLEAGTSAHVAGYCGDIGHKGPYGLLSSTQWHLVQMGGGLAVRAQQSGKRTGINLDVRRIRIQGADSASNNAVTFVRNLHFRNEMTEIAATADYPLLRLGGNIGAWTLNHRFSGTAGVALLHHAPMARVDRDNLCYDKLIELGYMDGDEWHDLRTVRTEGDSYAKWVTTLPLGMSWTVSADNGSGRPWHITLSGLVRWTWTDRLDDIHDQYADPWGMTPLGLALTSQSNPSDLPPCANPPSLSTFQFQQGLQDERQPTRGNAETRDFYWTMGLKVTRSLFAVPSQTFHKKRFRGPRVENKR